MFVYVSLFIYDPHDLFLDEPGPSTGMRNERMMRLEGKQLQLVGLDWIGF